MANFHIKIKPDRFEVVLNKNTDEESLYSERLISLYGQPKIFGVDNLEAVDIRNGRKKIDCPDFAYFCLREQSKDSGRVGQVYLAEQDEDDKTEWEVGERWNIPFHPTFFEVQVYLNQKELDCILDSIKDSNLKGIYFEVMAGGGQSAQYGDGVTIDLAEKKKWPLLSFHMRYDAEDSEQIQSESISRQENEHELFRSQLDARLNAINKNIYSLLWVVVSIFFLILLLS